MTPRERRIECSKRQFVKSAFNERKGGINGLLQHVENLFVEADAVFKQCKDDCGKIESLVNSCIGEKQQGSGPVQRRPPTSARKIIQSGDLI